MTRIRTTGKPPKFSLEGKLNKNQWFCCRQVCIIKPGLQVCIKNRWRSITLSSSLTSFILASTFISFQLKMYFLHPLWEKQNQNLLTNMQSSKMNSCVLFCIMSLILICMLTRSITRPESSFITPSTKLHYSLSGNFEVQFQTFFERKRLSSSFPIYYPQPSTTHPPLQPNIPKTMND